MTLELEANESGRLWSEDPQAWKRLLTPEGCPMCGEDAHPAGIHGNTVPHLHMHLFPRTPGDVHVGYPNHCRARFERTDEEIALMRMAVREQLSGRLVF